jgi:hypothetical protein
MTIDKLWNYIILLVIKGIMLNSWNKYITNVMSLHFEILEYNKVLTLLKLLHLIFLAKY